MKIICVAGARPNFVKAKPVVEALEARGIDVVLVHTGQHYDANMSQVFFDDLNLRPPDFVLGVGSGTHAHQTGKAMTALEELLPSLEPRMVVVFGDVNSTLAGALVAAKSGALVAHVEAGLRSRDWRMPEEINRVVVDRVSDLLLAPSHDAADNLRAEGYREEQIHVVGNVMVDTLFANVTRARECGQDLLARLGLAPLGYGLVTLHRPENVDDPDVLASLLKTLERLAARLPLVFPAHPRITERLTGAAPEGVRLLEPLGYLDFLALQASARVVLTDSGGIQEETTVLGIPCLTLRESTERPITVTEGTNTLVGRDTSRIEAAFFRALEGVEARRPPLWDGRAGERIAEVLVAAMLDEARVRPTGAPPILGGAP